MLKLDVPENRVFFLEIALIHFPSLNTYLTNATSNLLATLDAWAITLRDVTTEEAISVIHRWSRDELPRPSYYELGDFALHLRGVVYQDRVKSRKGQLIDMIRDREEPRSNYSHVSLRPYIARVLESGEQCKLGKITKAEHYATRDQVLAELAAAQVRR
jgi:hypothetical protein